MHGSVTSRKADRETSMTAVPKPANCASSDSTQARVSAGACIGCVTNHRVLPLMLLSPTGSLTPKACADAKMHVKDGDLARIAKAKRVKMRHIGVESPYGLGHPRQGGPPVAVEDGWNACPEECPISQPIKSPIRPISQSLQEMIK